MAAFKPKLYSYVGYQFSVPAQTVGEVCERIEERDGEVTRESLLNESRDVASPTHDLFEWRDDVAAEKWRLNQAANVLQCLKITIVNPDNTEQKQRAFVNVISRNTDGSYRSLDVAMNTVDLRSEVLKRALRELNTFKEKYESLSELSKVWDAITIATAEYKEAQDAKE